MSNTSAFGSNSMESISNAVKLSQQLGTANPLAGIIDTAFGGPSIRLLKDAIGKNGLQYRSAVDSALEMVRGIHTHNDLAWNLRMTQETSLKAVLDQLNTKPSWLESVLAPITPAWQNAFDASAAIAGLRSEFSSTRAGDTVLDRQLAGINAIESVFGTALNQAAPIRAMLDRLDLRSTERLRELYEPSHVRWAQDLFSRIHDEQLEMVRVLPHLTTPWTGVDWARIQNLIAQTEALTEEAIEDSESSDPWSEADIPTEDQAAFAKAMRPFEEAIKAALQSQELRDAKLQEAIEHLSNVQEQMLQKYSDLDERVRKTESKLPLWIRVTLKVLEVVVIGLLIDWAGSHTTPRINQYLGLLPAPVTTSKQTGMIRREAGKAVAETEGATDDTRYLRVVIRDSLPVFGNTDPQSPCIHRLSSGQVISIVKKEKKWRRIAWFDPEENEIQYGWVRAKYVAKIKN